MVFKNAISWVEIPTTDLQRAQRFYEKIFDIRMVPMDTPHIKMRMFPVEDPAAAISGALTFAEFYKPSATDGEGNRVGLHSVPGSAKVVL